MSLKACRSCGTPLRWAINPATQKRIPFNETPDQGGAYKLVLHHQTSSGVDVWLAVYLPPAMREADSSPRFVPHFATCRDAAHWRRAK